jgi:anti-sigma-K factor RskA
MAGLSGQVSELTAKLTAAPEIEYVAVLTDDKASASLLVTFDPKNKTLALKRVGNFREPPDKSLELWALPPGVAPKSLGVMSATPWFA